jgi:endonuclease/exonuclease/phosphatase family metal-dependent hydrolase
MGAVVFIGCSSESGGPGDGGTDSGVHPWDDHKLVVMSFNVMCSFCASDTGNDPWELRLTYLGDIIARHDPDLIGMQELTFAKEVGQVLAVAPGYKAVYAKNLPEVAVMGTAYPDATILYRASRFRVLESGQYWLSPTPDVPWSTGWAEGGTLYRIVEWAKMEQISDGRTFYFATTHFDNNQPNQPHSAVLSIQQQEPWSKGYPVIFVGDFNSNPSTPAYATLATGIDGAGFHFGNAYDVAGGTYTIVTNQDPKPVYDPAYRIDHIWLAGTANWTASGWNVDMTTYGDHNYYPSDHFPIACTVNW